MKTHRSVVVPMTGRTSYPLLFDRRYQPKPAFHAVIDVAGPKTTGQ